MAKPKICAVVAIGRNRELGKAGKLLWRIPDDLKRFRKLTLGHPIIMGRKTFESIVGYLGKPLPERTNIVVTHQFDKLIAGNPQRFGLAGPMSEVLPVSSIEKGIQKAKELDPKEIHIGGGAEIYKQSLPFIDKLYLTIIDAVDPEADAFFPPYESEFSHEVYREDREWKGIKYRWIDLER